MTQKNIELILLRQTASYLTVPIFMVDPAGNLIFYNQPAEQILELPFAETNNKNALPWTKFFVLADPKKQPLEKFPLAISCLRQRNAHGKFVIHIKNRQQTKRIELFSFPLIGHVDRPLGAAAIFQEL